MKRFLSPCQNYGIVGGTTYKFRRQILSGCDECALLSLRNSCAPDDPCSNQDDEVTGILPCIIAFRLDKTNGMWELCDPAEATPFVRPRELHEDEGG